MATVLPEQVEQAELQQRGQSGYDHEHEKAPSPAHETHSGTQSHAGSHCDARHGVVVCIEVMEHGGLQGLGVHHAAGEAVVNPIPC